MLFVEPHAGGAHDTFKDQRRLALLATGLPDKGFLHGWVVVDRALAQKLRHDFARRGHGFGPEAVVIAQPAGDDGLGHGLTATAAHGLRHVIDFNLEVDAAWQRLAAMVAGTVAGLGV